MKSLLSLLFGKNQKSIVTDAKPEIQITEAQKRADEAKILSALKKSKTDLTPPEIAKIYGWESNKAFRRMSKLCETNVVKRIGRRKCKIHGTTCSAYLPV